MSSIVLFIIITFLAGIYFYSKPGNNEGIDYKLEGFSMEEDNNYDINEENKKKYEKFKKVKPNEARCPNLLIQKGSKIYLHNTTIAPVPGVNPVEFDNLEDYTEFLDWQRSEGIRCPVLFLQKGFDAQGYETYTMRPDILDPQGGIPPISANSISKKKKSEKMSPDRKSLLVDSSRNDKPYNQHNYPGFDATPYYIGLQTPLDQMNEQVQHSPISPNAMDDNWGGASYTQSLVDKGYYKGNEVSLYVS
jgi:hypothetical protein